MVRTNEEHLNTIIRHVKRVEDNCNRLASLLKNDDFEFSLQLIRLGRIHDASKFGLVEFYDLRIESKNFPEALILHRKNNPHHPEYWESIQKMPDIYIAEMVCDCVARGQEFGSDTRKWFREEATKIYEFTVDDRVGLLIEKYLNLLLTEPFKKD